MKNHIKVIPRSTFKEIFEGYSQVKPEYAIISIHEPKNKILTGYSEAWPVILPNSDNVLNLWFNDCEEPNPDIEAVLFDEDMADVVFNFVEKNKESKFWVLHCTMGQSRSGAIGAFLADYFEIKWEDFKRDNPQIKPNALVSKLLTKRLLQGL
jgi:predicted protein tyrosine phosphatase